MIDDNYFNIDLDDIKSTDVDNIEEDVDEHYKEEENKDRITIIHDNYKPNKPYRPPKKEVQSLTMMINRQQKRAVRQDLYEII